MFILCDTCFLNHARDLYEGIGLDIRPILEKLQLAYTPELQKEYNYFQIGDFLPVNRMILLPITENVCDTLLKKNPFLDYLDRADQSLIAAMKEYQVLILSDDGDLILELYAMKMNGILLPEFLLSQVKVGIISKNQVAKAITFWENNKHFAKKDLKKWRKDLTQQN